MTGLIKLNDFRNYDRFTVEFKPGINVVIGDNGRGKTNLLEAIFLLLQGRSTRTTDSEELIRHGQGEAVVEGIFYAGREIRKRVVITRDGTTHQGKETREIQAVLFQPDDIWMVKGAPEIRRRFLDEASLDVKKGYRETLREYQRVLKQRNEAIRSVRKGARQREYMRSWNPLLCKHGSDVIAERTQTIRALRSEMAGLAEGWGKGNLELKYYTSMGEALGDEERMMEKIERMEEAEIRRGVSLIGPHRDELLVFLADKNARRECSQGEQKLVMIMWRIAQARLIEGNTGRKALLLMDDCLSELDEENRGLLMGELGGWEQAIITSTDDIPEFARTSKVFLERTGSGR